MRWSKASDRARKLDLWRTAVGRHFAGSARVLRVAWTLEWLFNLHRGYAFPTDARLAQKLGIPILKVQQALLDLERAGAIVRASVVQTDGRKQRRIWPSTELPSTIFPAVGNMDTPHDGVKHIPHRGETESLIERAAVPTRRLSTTQQDAKRTAELREQAEARRLGGGPDTTTTNAFAGGKSWPR
ncbi:hypothetical protein UB31_18840 [Bradyrhizobium sp. LTSP849]|nr:hypothetical protein UB31_18840 [Bradyrhizobium sp. LTSP849]